MNREDVERVLADSIAPYLEYFAKRVGRGFPIDEDGKAISWSKWLARRQADGIMHVLEGKS
jgi:hypothetical protein